MNKKRKAVWIAGVLLIMTVLAGFGSAVNSGACGFGSYQRDGFCKRGLAPFMQDEIKNFMIWRMDKESKDLGLSEDQQEKYEILRSQFLKTVEKAIESRTQIHKKAMVTLENENPDLSSMATEVKTHMEIMSGAISECLTQFAEFFNALDPGQKKTITDKIKERVNDYKSGFSCNKREF